MKRYICNNCGEEIKDTDRYHINVERKGGGNFVTETDAFCFCEKCYRLIFNEHRDDSDPKNDVTNVIPKTIKKQKTKQKEKQKQKTNQGHKGDDGPGK